MAGGTYSASATALALSMTSPNPKGRTTGAAASSETESADAAESTSAESDIRGAGSPEAGKAASGGTAKAITPIKARSPTRKTRRQAEDFKFKTGRDNAPIPFLDLDFPTSIKSTTCSRHARHLFNHKAMGRQVHVPQIGGPMSVFPVSSSWIAL